VKPFIWILAVLAGLAGLLAAWLIVPGTRSTPDCPQSVYIVSGPDGEPLECVCAKGSMATCFKPGP